MNNETALVKAAPTSIQFSAFGNMTDFENAQRMAKALCTSSMVPETYRGEQNIGSCIIAVEMANRIGANVLSVMQNLYVVHGKPAWSSQFLIACLNASGRFSPLRYTMTGEKDKDSFGCIAWATDKSGERLESPEITVAIAKAEGWYGKNGSKWKTMPELMLRYRTATLFARLYAPEISMGIHTDDEVIDVVEIAPVVTSPNFAPKGTPAKKATVEAEVVTTPVTPPTPAAVRKKAEAAKPVPEAVKPAPEGSGDAPVPSEPYPTPTPVDNVATEPAPAEDGLGSDPFEVPPSSPEMQALLDAMAAHEVSPQQLIRFSSARNLLKPEAFGKEIETLGLADIQVAKLQPLCKNILAAGDTLKKIKAA